MDVMFLLKAECRVDDIDIKASAEEIEDQFEQMFDDCDIKAVVKIEGLTYLKNES